MHPVDIMEIYRVHELKQEGDPESEKEKQRRELVLWQTVTEQDKDTEESSRQRLSVIKIRHEMLEAIKKERELEFKQKKPVEERPKEEPPIIRPIIVSYRKKKKRENIW